MKTGAEPALSLAPDRHAATVAPIRALPVVAEDTARAQLLRRLAADRLRDLRDDGVTVAYMARMYGVDPAMMEEMIATVGRGTR